jgi:2-dehydro-3-deoxyphosphogluconate aldolase/(4S)-4-hydroxy-2-oxoglutarate aldolase
MSVATDTLAEIERARLISIIRVDDARDELARALIDGGVTVVELSLVSSGALETLARWRSAFPELLVGAGTVLDEGACERAVAAGAQFLISPGLEPGVAAVARSAGIPYIPGALTPTEVRSCLAEGATLVKLFPAAPLGSAYVSQLLGPFPNLRLVPTGGIDAANAPAFLQAGAAAVAIGASLVGGNSTYDDVHAAARRLVSAIAATDKGEVRNAS